MIVRQNTAVVNPPPAITVPTVLFTRYLWPEHKKSNVENRRDFLYDRLMVKRTAYLDRIKRLKDEPCVKIITGVRHSGKSFLLYQIIAELKLSGIDDEHIIHVNFENAALDVPRTAREIETFIETVIGQKTEKDKKYYIFFDEIQTITGWEKVVRALWRQQRFDIYISASNMARKSKNGGGAEVEKKYFFINFKPFSFAEYKENFAPAVKREDGLLAKAIMLKKSTGALFGSYVRYGGFPSVYTGLHGTNAVLSSVSAEYAEAARTSLKSIYSSILLHDVIRRAKIRNVELLEHIIDIIFPGAGQENSPKKIAESLREKRYTKDLNLVSRYITALENAFVIKKIPCCNLLTGKLISTNARYFMSDHGLLVAARGGCNADSTAAAWNILLHDLEYREFIVCSGKIKTRIVDFFAKRGERFIFLQTVTGTDDAETIEQKTETLHLLNDIEHFSPQEKYVIFLDETVQRKYETVNDIHYLSLCDFLLLEDV
jgi:predicted AAA+ superfamily ATPase